ncbi:peptidylprolyl isomerase [Aureimonas phyllosphaerae]|uniref:Peptidyl-prolyl cis-trans isomerase SurA n=1 Tax=Aureimonas phyllosphaerae TaxID=1166078 RepID=A0A7W6BRT3_9HYPH|nr:peptidylprolyl isomerase [Aureimonas phyllosphaerae]MBB3935135.1 peptidyl-prolyl cis-trans isomerase SurA [Aureimonas phyllosphaerae]MBB3959143.1 peptidyl-prolyl cis-trans isomerase SurA [Aureimonas phyllosphaerae]SFF07428.1 periplasmic chaperone for outer membrane proteins SurA [Aureimonas phyllosphaerae]
MIARNLAVRLAVCSLLASPLALAATASLSSASFAASEIKVVVNKQPITTYQIQQRAAFLKLRRAPGGEEAATNELIDEAIKRQEIARRRINIPDAAIDEAFGRFAKDNKLTEAQLTQVLSQAGFSAKGFKDYIRVQMGWGQAVIANVRQTERLSEQDVVARMLKEGGSKPKVTEYSLQQVIFVVPNDKRSSQLDRRMSEANSLRQRFTNCQSTFETARGLRDVTVRDLGRVAEPELPPRWKDDIMNTSRGRATKPQATERGVELIGVCDTRTVSDDQVAAMVFQEKDLAAMGKKEPDKDYLAKLKEKATIVRR